MNTTATTSADLIELFATELYSAGFDDHGDIITAPYSCTTTYRMGDVEIGVTVSEVTKPGVDDLIEVEVRELDDRGWPSGVTHRTSHLSARNLPAVVALAAALAEVA